MIRTSEPDPLARVELSLIVEEVTSGIRHELRNKLGSIRNAAFYVKRRLAKTEGWAQDPKLDAMSALLESDVAAASELLKGTDDRLHTRLAEPVDVSSCVAQAVQHARFGSAVSVQVDLPSAPIVADAVELAVAVRCLLENAAEAMGSGGSARVFGKADDARYWLSVGDEGPGFSDEARESATSAFYTTKPGHVGLGLCIAQRVAQRRGGKVLVGSSSPTVVSLVLALDKVHEDEDADRSVGR